MRKLLLVWIAVIAGCQFGAASPQKDVVIQFYELREKTLDQRGTKLDLDKLLSLLTGRCEVRAPNGIGSHDEGSGTARNARSPA